VISDRTLICLEASEEEMSDITSRFRNELGGNYAEFRDEDLGNMLTAVAFQPVDTDVGFSFFSRFKLA